MHYAACSECGNPKAIDVLVEAGADIAATEKHGDDCLLFAAGECNINVVHAILRHARRANGLERTGLQRALRYAGNSAGKEKKPAAPMVDLLLRWGAHESGFGGSPWRSVGKGAPRDVASQEDVKRVTNAPKDRAWRRRGFFVVCRPFPDRAQLKREESDTPTTRCTRRRLAATDDASVSEWAGVASRLLRLDDGVFRAILEYVYSVRAFNVCTSSSFERFAVHHFLYLAIAASK